MTTKQTTRAPARQVHRRLTKPLSASTTAPAKLFALVAGMRPSKGPRLFSHTIAALEMLGISRTTAAPAERLEALIGPRALKYHATTTHNFDVKGDSVKLSRTGVEFFQAREVEGKAPRTLIDAFKAVLKTGKPSVEAEVQAHHIHSTPV